MSDLTTKVLIEIRDEIKATNRRIDGMNESLSGRIDGMNESLSGRIDVTNERIDRLARRQVESEIRLATEVIAVSDAVKEVASLLRADRALEKDVEDLKGRVAVLERKTG